MLEALGVEYHTISGRRLSEVFGTPIDVAGEEPPVVALTTADGDVRNFRVVSMPVRTAVGTEYFGQLVDCTDEIVLERTKDQVASVISHELRTPLTAVVGYALLLTDGGEGLDEEERQSAIRVIRDEAEHLLRLVNDLVDFTGLETGRFEVRPETMDMHEVVGAVLQRMNPEIVAEVELDVAPVAVKVDRTRMEQLLSNLLTNASRYGKPPFKIGVDAAGDTLVIRVSDDGAGIPVAERDRIFDSFYQGSHRHVGMGSGLGLAICKAIVQAHGGTIELEDGQGARFHIRIPSTVIREKVG